MSEMVKQLLETTTVGSQSGSACTSSVRTESGQRVSQTPCFTAGTLIKTIEGDVRAEDLRPGDRVLTRDNGYQPLVWCGTRELSADELADRPDLIPVHIKVGAMAPGVPERDLLVSPEHRILLSNHQIKDWFQADEVLIGARHLVCYPGIELAKAESVTYVHFMCAQHEIVLAEGCWSESFQPADLRAETMSAAHLRELLELFPELRHGGAAFPVARRVLDIEEVAALHKRTQPKKVQKPSF